MIKNGIDNYQKFKILFIQIKRLRGVSSNREEQLGKLQFCNLKKKLEFNNIESMKKFYNLHFVL